jgi:hypothetical protein
VTTVIETPKKTAIKQWIKELKSGEHNQGQGALKSSEDGKVYYCCLGVLAEKVLEKEFFHAEWGEWSYGEQGNTGVLLSEDSEALGLDENITQEELVFFNDDYGLYISELADREWVLVKLNDNGYTFEQIANIIEELGWAE